MKKILVVFGTRPEAIKMCPVIRALKKIDDFCVEVCITSQHKEMLAQVLTVFNIQVDYDLNIMKDKQTLFDITENILHGMNEILTISKPDLVLVHGDTTTTFTTALACFYKQISIGHVEAGLRTKKIYSPYPEEFNRQVVSIISKYNFAPTKLAANNLEKEGRGNIYITGNTAIDCLSITIDENYTDENLIWAQDSKLILLTTHRRENLGKPMENIFKAILKIVNENKGVKIIYPIHMNPTIKDLAESILCNNKNIRLISAIDVFKFHNYLNKCFIVLTDSGGIQEEAPALNKPVLVLRELTERPEGVEAGTSILVGTDVECICEKVKLLVNNPAEYSRIANSINPFGDGLASTRIAKILSENL